MNSCWRNQVGDRTRVDLMSMCVLNTAWVSKCRRSVLCQCCWFVLTDWCIISVAIINMFLCVFVCVCVCTRVQEEQAAKLKADNIRVALEKIKEAQVKKVGLVHTRRKGRCYRNMCCIFVCLFVHVSASGTWPADCFLGQVSVTPHWKLWSMTAVVITHTHTHTHSTALNIMTIAS